MSEPGMPTTLPSPVALGGFRFVAVDAAGDACHWVEEEMVWVRLEEGVGNGLEGDG